MRRSFGAGRALLAFTVLMACGGGGGGGATGPAVPPDYTGLSTTNLPEAKRLDVPLRSGYGAFCYVQSLSMAMAYLDPSSTEQEAFAFAGFGASVSYGTPFGTFAGGFVPGPGRGTDFHHRTLLESYGARFVIGSGGGFGGYWSDLGAEFLGAAIGKLSFRSADEALSYLKAAVGSGRPVQVHLDMIHLPTYCRATNVHPDDCDRLAGASSHYVVVTGYDLTSIYINDAVWLKGWGNSTDPRDPRFKDVQIPVAEFMDAWQATREFGPYGPYWMLFVEQTSGAALGKRSFPEVVAMQKDLSRDVVAQIDRYASAEISGTRWSEIAEVRRLFAGYLEGHGHAEAGALYRSLADDYDACGAMPVADARAMLTGLIRTKELEVRTKY